jgi:site-specific recombinase XerD
VELDARKLVHDLMKQIGVTEPDTDEPFMALFLRQKRSEHTRRAYAQALAKFLHFTGGKSLSSIMLDNMLGYRELLAEDGYAKATQVLKLSAVKSLLAFSQEAGYLRFNVGAACQAPIPKTSWPRAF